MTRAWTQSTLWIALALVLAGSAPTETSQHLVSYRDCINSPIYPDMDIFVKSKGLDSSLRLHSLMKGVSIEAHSDSQGRLTALSMGGKRLELAALKEGIEFGAGATLQTLEFHPGFDPAAGGKVTLGVLKSFGLVKSTGIRKATLPGPKPLSGAKPGLSASFGNYYKKKWQELTYSLTRRNGAWLLTDEQGRPVRQLFTVVSSEVHLAPLRNKNLIADFLSPAKPGCDDSGDSSGPDIEIGAMSGGHALLDSAVAALNCATPSE